MDNSTAAENSTSSLASFLCQQSGAELGLTLPPQLEWSLEGHVLWLQVMKI